MYNYQTIGNYRSAALRDINNPISEFYIEPANGVMSCQNLSANYDKLQQQIDFWFSEINAGKNKKEEANINSIIAIQQAKQDQYAALMQDKCTITINTGGGNNEEPKTSGGGTGLTVPETPTTTGGSNTTLLLLAGLAFYLFILKK